MAETPHADDLISADEAAELLEVARDRIDVLVDQGLLAPLPDSGGRFRRADVVSVDLLGG